MLYVVLFVAMMGCLLFKQRLLWAALRIYSRWRPILPADGQVFELTMQTPISGPGLLECFGYRGWFDGWGSLQKDWTYTGGFPDLGPYTITPEPIKWTGPVIRKFKLIPARFVGVDFRKKQLEPHGDTPFGGWLQVFRTTFPKNDGRGLIGVMDPGWSYLDHDFGYFPVLKRKGKGWSPTFWFGNFKELDQRWLVDVTDRL